MKFVVGSFLTFMSVVKCIDERCYRQLEVITNGCTVPVIGWAPYKHKFKGACERHDLCYGCGNTYGQTKTRCDEMFWDDLEQRCSSLSFFRRHPCRLAANAYYFAAIIGGGSYFKNFSRQICIDQPWIASCFP